jgi:hypothetical protein
MKINNKNDVINWLKRLKDDHPLSVDECRLQKSDGSMSSEKQKVYTDQVIKNRYQDMIDYLESDEVTSGRTIFDNPIDDDGFISIKWHRDDVKSQADGMLINLTDDEVDNVLYSVRNNHEVFGSRWDNIDFHIEEVVKERKTK